MNWKAVIACNFTCFFKTERFLRHSCSHTYCKYGNISGTVQDGVVVILSDLKFSVIYLLLTFLGRDFSYSSAADDKIWSNVVHHMVPL